MKTMGELMDVYEAELEAKAKAEMAAEKAAFEALPEDEQERIWQERLERQAARFADLMDYDPYAYEDEEEDEDEDEDEEEDEEEGDE
jgi:hypothetical protein